MGLGATELIIILGIVVLLFGASRLPGLATALGQSLRAFRSGSASDDRAIEAKADPQQR